METMTLKDEARRLVAEIRAQGDEIPDRDEHVANVLEGLAAKAAILDLIQASWGESQARTLEATKEGERRFGHLPQTDMSPYLKAHKEATAALAEQYTLAREEYFKSIYETAPVVGKCSFCLDLDGICTDCEGTR